MSPAFTRLLVPLDGSRLAEAVLPATETLAAHFSSQVILIHVLEERAPATVHGDRHLMDAGEADQYLQTIAARLRAGGIPVETHVHEALEGDVARSVVEHTEEFAPDLVVLCAHGSGGLRDWLYGNIAQQVLQRGTRPVLLIQPNRDGSAPPFAPRCILVPLDGKHEYVPAVSVAAMLAGVFSARLHLTLVVPTLGTLPKEQVGAGILLPTTMRAILDLDEQESQAYLDRIASQSRAQGLTVQTEVIRGETVQELLQYAERLPADLMVMASHGRAGLNASLTGSVASRLTARVSFPMLLIRLADSSDSE
ncbi:MAG TPA: universal stress protein [Chthonomonadaceae bacterium]|nr:universal stress protein [Chthonomonadaceae bacterium]